MNGGFSIQRGCRNPFGKIPADQAIEETINKDTQTAGGTKGFSPKRAAVKRHYLTAEYRSTPGQPRMQHIIFSSRSSFYSSDARPQQDRCLGRHSRT